MSEIRRTQEFKVYRGQGAQVVDDIQADIAARGGWYIKQMGLFDGATTTTVWVLWEREYVA